ncbi:hypothetical protein GUJ93_ZPchr0005g15135 [Zizania palustris]|uniref:Uncharacterized protein n=1 Tax=Zizania palustris TaxID=103762 RepID=A0A8J5T4J6_ZIZPA|nr:hypothetical protein GUJ93_ZPchr0005g15135 [Zizania palustris]
MEALPRWAAELGVCDSLLGPSTSSCLGRSLVIADFPDAGGRGLAAACNLRCGELVLRVPRSALFTSDRVMANDPQVASCVPSHLPRLSSVQTLIICLLTEVGRGRSSNWYLYSSQLPTYYTILATFNDFEIEALQADDAIWVAQKALRGIRSDWEEATPFMKRNENNIRIVNLTKISLMVEESMADRVYVMFDDGPARLVETSIETIRTGGFGRGHALNDRVNFLLRKGIAKWF